MTMTQNLTNVLSESEFAGTEIVLWTDYMGASYADLRFSWVDARRADLRAFLASHDIDAKDCGAAFGERVRLA